MRDKFLHLIGAVPADKNAFKRRRRWHQGWWRTAVLLEEAGPHPQITKAAQTIANMLNPESASAGKNYLSPEAFKALNDEFSARMGQFHKHRGLIQEDRAYGNLLSSQPLCFNFWGHLKYKPELANQILSALIPDFHTLESIRFECEPGFDTNLTDDNSAFDVLIEYEDSQAHKRQLGLAVKYTDELKSKPYDSPAYRTIFEQSRDRFNQPYEFYIHPNFNQLFRNQLMACAGEHETGIPVITGLFCSREDHKALETAKQFRDSLVNGEEQFLIITYEDFLTAAQRQPLEWEDRVWTMLLWARYIGLELSEEAYKAQAND